MSDTELIALCQDIAVDLRAEDLIEPCPTCGGNGVITDHARLCNVQCPDCDGHGFTEI